MSGYAYWSPAEDAELLELRRKQLTLAQIAKLMDRSYESCKARVAELRKSGVVVAPDANHRKAKLRHTTTQRKCLCCGRLFPSEGPHNRLCTGCRSKSCSPYALYA